MPMSTPEMHEKWQDDDTASAYIKKRGWHIVGNGMIVPPPTPSPAEAWEAAQYLCDEWDYALSRYEDMFPRIIGVAVKVGALVFALPAPGRHYQLFHSLDEAQYPHLSDPDAQGFLTSSGLFVTREMALSIVRANGQSKQPIIDSILTSADLW